MRLGVVEMPEHPNRVALIALGDELCALASHLAAAEARWLVLLAEFDRREGWGQYGCRSCAHWLSWKLGIDRRTGQEKVRVARALEDLPVTRAAFLAGTLTYCKVRAVTRMATPATDEELAEMAKIATGAHLERLCRGYRRTKNLDEDDEERRSGRYRPKRFLSYDIDDDGSVTGTFRLAPDEGMVFLAGVDAERRRLYDGVNSEDRPEPDVQAADALVAMAEADLALVDPDASRFVVTIHSDAPTLQGEDTGRKPQIEDGPALDTDTARRLACDCVVNRMVWGPDGAILDHGRNTRSIPRPLRRSLKARDGCCRFPGCGRERHLRAHHITHWAHGGETKMENLVLLCAEHHRQVHEGGWDLRGDADQALLFLDPDGQAADPGSVTIASDPDRIGRDHVALGLDIIAKTAESTWLGERCDYDTAIISLLRKERLAAEEHNRAFATAA